MESDKSEASKGGPSKDRSLNQADMNALLSRLNAYIGRFDTPAKLEGLQIQIEEGKIKATFKLIPTGNLDALKWHAMNENVEKIILEFVEDNLKHE